MNPGRIATRTALACFLPLYILWRGSWGAVDGISDGFSDWAREWRRT